MHGDSEALCFKFYLVLVELLIVSFKGGILLEIINEC